MLYLFRPSANATLAVTTTSGAVALPISSRTTPQELTVRLIAEGGTVFFAFGVPGSTAIAGGTITATDSGSTPLLAGSVETFRVDPGVSHIAAVTASGTATLRITIGEGQ